MPFSAQFLLTADGEIPGEFGPMGDRRNDWEQIGNRSWDSRATVIDAVCGCCADAQRQTQL